MPTRPRIGAGLITREGDQGVKMRPEVYPQMWITTMTSMEVLHPLAGLEQREEDELQRAFRGYAQELVDREPGVQLGADPDELHKQRVTTRRARELLRSTRAQLADPDRAERIRDELRWLADLLGEVRDRDVLIAYLVQELGTIEEAAAFGAILELLDAEREDARKEVLAALDSSRYRELLAELERRPHSATESAWRPRRPRSTSVSAER
jgi:CHAD domain-containing protein